MNMTRIALLMLFFFSLIMCREDDKDDDPMTPVGCNSSMPIGEDYDLDIPFYVSIPALVPEDNPMKQASVDLGRFLFWDTRLSGDNSMSCGTCHSPQAGFSDPVPVSVGIDGSLGTRNAMALVNLVFQPIITWDGHQPSLEAQSGAPVENPIEMHDDWDDVLIELEDDSMYSEMFQAAYGSPCIDKTRATKAIAQFIRTMTSFNSKYDKAFFTGGYTFTALENLGLELWSQEGGFPPEVPIGQGGADCFHCHSIETQLFSDNQFHNNGLDSVFTDLGQGGVTGNPNHNGRFKTPTLRNIEFSAPYMHDGRFATLEEVIEHYNSGGHPSATVDPFMKFTVGGLQLTEQKKAALIAFMKTLSDTEFINNPDFQDPF
jgi:cytochrome c peroxidase